MLKPLLNLPMLPSPSLPSLLTTFSSPTLPRPRAFAFTPQQSGPSALSTRVLGDLDAVQQSSRSTWANETARGAADNVVDHRLFRDYTVNVPLLLGYPTLLPHIGHF